MKKTFLLIAICIAGLKGAKGQIAKGNLFYGSDIGSSTNTFGTYTSNYSDGNTQTQDDKQNLLNLSPQFGVFLSNHFVLGGFLGLDYNHESDNESNTTASPANYKTSVNNITFSVGPFARYYFFNTKPSATVFYIEEDLGAGTGTGSFSDSYTYANNENSTYTAHDNSIFIFKTESSIGITHFITKNVGLDVALGYLFYDDHYTTAYNTQATNSAGAVTITPGSVKISQPENEIIVSAGFHFFVP